MYENSLLWRHPSDVKVGKIFYLKHNKILKLIIILDIYDVKIIQILIKIKYFLDNVDIFK